MVPLIKLGDLRPGRVRGGYHDGRQIVAMVLRRDGETAGELLTRLDLAIAIKPDLLAQVVA